MPAKFHGKLLAPPADLDQRTLPIKLVSGSIFRIHRTSLDGLFFGKNESERFDDPFGQYGVLYAALQPEAALAEVFLRQLSLMLVQEISLQERSITEIHVNRLQCVDISGSGLRRVSCDNRIATEKPCRTVGQWSRAFFLHPQKPDGIIYRSRHNPQFKCLAIFDRCQPNVSLGPTVPLMTGTRRSWTIRQITKYNLAIEPAP